MATRKPASQFNPTARAKDVKEAAKDRARQTKTPTVPAATPVYTELRSRSEAPKPNCTHTSTANDEKRREVAKREHKEAVKDKVKEDVKLVKADAAVRFLATSKDMLTTGRCLDQNAETLRTYCKNKGWGGYSALKKDELVSFIMKGGIKPAAQQGSTRYLREKASELKKQGLISGPVSSAKVATLKAAVAKANMGQSVTVSKPEPKKGSMDYNKDLLRNKDGKGYRSVYVAKAKAMFGEKASISTLKAAELAKLVAALAL